MKFYTTYKKFTHNFNHKNSFSIVNVAKEKHPLINIDETLRRKNQKKGKKISIIHDKFLVQTTDESCITKKEAFAIQNFA